MGYAGNNRVQHEPLPEIKKSNLSLDQSFIELEDSFLDSILNFDGWVEDRPLAEVMNSEEKPNFEQMDSLKIKKENEEEVCGSDKLGVLIQEGIGRVCLTSSAENDIRHDVKQETNNLEVVSDVIENEVRNDTEVNENEVRNDTEVYENEVRNDTEVNGDVEDDETSSLSPSSSSDDDEKEGLKKVEMEEGEIREEVVGWSDDEEEEDGDIVKGPIRSMNEVKNLPPVPPVTVTIQPHHQTLPVGVVLSIMGSQVVVEGVEDHNPLSEGSILWITESRSPLGVVDEIFGPVKNPYYIVRYNSETEIPLGIQQGSLISFVPEFADYVLNSNNLYKKGYDASGENDEECSEELEFSDDEKEAEYKRMLKMSKRRSNGEKNGHMKKDNKSRNRGGNWKNDHQPSVNSQLNSSSSHHQPSVNSQLNSSSSGPQAFSQAPHITPSGVWPHRLPSIQPQNMGFPSNGFPSNAPPFMQQNFSQQPYGVLNLATFVPQFNTTPGQMFPPNFVQGNFGAFGCWPAGMPQNNFNQSQAGPPMMFQGLPQGVAMPNTLQMENNNGAPRPLVPAGNGENCQNPNQGNTFSNRGGRKPFQRGGGRFRGGRRSR